MPDSAPRSARPSADPSGTDAHLVPGSEEPTGDAAPTEAPPLFGPPAAPGEMGQLGPYRVLKQLGKGGMGAVYLALDPRLNRKIALKVMLPKFAADRDAKERFLREGRAAGQISHENVVPVFEADERDGVPYIAMPFLQGYPLDDYLRKKGHLTPEQVVRVGQETAAGLAAAHALGLVHRDIKPANLWLEAPGGRIKILDFGLARPIDAAVEVTRSGAVVGTPAYMAPEQAAGEKLDHRADLFSLGAVLYRLATGRNPFPGANMMAVLTALATRDPVPVRTLNPNVPAPLSDLIHRLLAKDPAARPQTAREIAVALAGVARAMAAGELSTADPMPLGTVVPEVVYVPIAVTVAPEHSVFADIDADEDLSESDRPPVVRPHPAPPRGVGMWVAAGLAVVVAVALGVAVVTGLNKRGPRPEVRAPDAQKSEPFKDGGRSVVRPPGDASPRKDDEAPAPGPLPPFSVMDLLARDTTAWTVLKPIDMKSEGDATLQLQGDGSILVSGTNPDKDVYTVTLRGLPASVQGLRLDVLPHDTLPQKGPGRAGDGRFILTEIKAQLDPPKAGGPRALKLAEARADFSTGADSREHLAIDGNDETGWVSEAGKPHFAVFKLAEPVSTAEGTVLRVALEFRHYNQRHTLGRFRLSAAQLDPDRIAAEYVLSLGGAVKIESDDRDIKAANQLPKGPFRLASVNLSSNQKVTDAGLEHLRGLKLTALSLAGCRQVRNLSPLKGMPLTSLNFHTCTQIQDLSPLKGMPLTSLNLHDGPQVADLEPLRGMKLTELLLGGNPVRDLSPLKDMPLTHLTLSHCGQIQDLSALKGLSLIHLALDDTKIGDLEPLKGMALKSLYINAPNVSDLKPLEGMSLDDVRLTPKNITSGLDVVRNMKSLKVIGPDHYSGWPAKEFWERYDKGEFAK